MRTPRDGSGGWPRNLDVRVPADGQGGVLPGLAADGLGWLLLELVVAGDTQGAGQPATARVARAVAGVGRNLQDPGHSDHAWWGVVDACKRRWKVLVTFVFGFVRSRLYDTDRLDQSK